MEIYRQKGDFAKAHEAADKAKAIDGNNVNIRYNEVSLLEAEGKLPEAIAALKEILNSGAPKSTDSAQKAVRIEPAPAKRPWLPPQAYRCPPITFANQLGYLLSLEGPLDLAWDGRPTPDGIQIDLHGQPLEARTDFGPGIASLFPGIVVKTPPGIGLLVKAVPNQPLGRLMLMEGFVETDWLEFTFNLSFKFLFPGRVQVPPRTPLCALLPYPTVLLKDALAPNLVQTL